MRSVFRVAVPATRKLPPLPYQVSPFSPLGRHTTFGTALSDAYDPPAGQDTPSSLPPSVAVCHARDVEVLTVDAQQLPFLARPLPVCDIRDTESDSVANPDTSESATVHSSCAASPYPPGSSFPVFGPFDLLCCIQNGGFASAWAAKDQSTGRLLCLKVFQSLHDPDTVRSVRMELRIFRRMVKSKGGERGKQFLIELNRSIQHGPAVFFAMELMAGDLGTYLSTDPEWCKAHAPRWIAQIALGIESLHEMGILHRDIKTENILIDCRENIRIIDFGLSYLEPNGNPLIPGYKYAVDFLGTPPYMAPEMLRNHGMPAHRRKFYGTTVDWWGLGCILFELESEDHMLLFDTEDDVHTYVAWTQRPTDLDQVFPKFEGLAPVVVNLLEGLLQAQPFFRYSLKDLERHDYFLLFNGGNEFDSAAVRASERAVRPELVPEFPAEHGPIHVIEAARLGSIYDWANIKWARSY